jgi:hypothetical protein
MPSRAELERAANASKAVLEKRAELIRAGQNPDGAEAQPQPTPQPSPDAAPPPVVQEPPPVDLQPGVDDAYQAALDRQSEDEPGAQDPPPAPSGNGRDNDPGYLRHLVSTAEGRLRDVQAQLQGQKEFYENRLRELGQTVQELQTQLSQRSEKDADRDFDHQLATMDLKEYYTDEEIAEHGEPFLRKQMAANLKANRKLNGANKPAAPTVNQAEIDARIARVEHQAHDRVFRSEVTRLMPNWKALHQDARFRTWLAARDPVLGSTRDAAIKAARASYDAERAVAIMKQFTVAPARQQSVMPPTVGSGGPPPPAGKMKFSVWQREATRKARGGYKGREADYQKLENQFKAAQAAGQIDYDA